MNDVVVDWLDEHASRGPDTVALIAHGRTWARAELSGRVDALVGALADEGVARGHRVAALLANGIDSVALVHAARRLGAVLVPLGPRAAVPELHRQVIGSTPWLMLYHASTAALAVGLQARTEVRALSMDALPGPGGRHRSGTASDGGGMVDLDLPATILYTSGTTGRPRAALLSHRNHAASARAWSLVLEPRPSDRWLACLPLHHVAGLAIVERTARWGVALEVHERFDAGRVSESLDAGISHCSLVAVQLARLLEVRRGRGVPGSLRAILLGGGPVPAPLLREARATGYPVLTTYGMTETASGVVVGGLDASTVADPSAGRALPGVEVAIAPEADGSGEVLVRGEMVFDGYVEPAAAGRDSPPAAATTVRDGWLHTGDVGSLGDDGLLRVAGRVDDRFVSGGENVQPAEVEAVLLEHPDVLDAGVVGQADPTWGMVPVAAVVVRPDSGVDDKALAQHCRERLSRHKVPVEFRRVTALPRSGSGKLRRAEVLQLTSGEPQ
jgi:O-succinylbenzoic acid--CoA ligase